MINKFAKEATLEEVIAFIEQDFPQWFWSLRKCTCGKFGAVLMSPDYNPIAGIRFGDQGPIPFASGHIVSTHHETKAGALWATLELAQGIEAEGGSKK